MQDVSLNLNNSNYKPYHKPYNEILCIIKIQITRPASLNKHTHTHRLKKEFPPYHVKKPYLMNQKKYTKKL